MTLIERDQENYDKGFVLATRIFKYVQDNLFEKPEVIAEMLECSIEEVLIIKNICDGD